MIILVLLAGAGILKTNDVYTKLSGRRPDNELMVSSDIGKRLPEPDLYNEIKLSRHSQNKLKIYFKAKPLDIRFGIGQNIIYINKNGLNNGTDNINSSLDKVSNNFKRGVNNIKNSGNKLIGNIKGK
jgi:hypothetical protein